ncbi:MAG TPA: endo-1,4-beta-xylanase [Bacteroidota bacterium]|nr:endo-1,4-beta-xylanase [Bacteroidota bacterium]
MQNKIKRWALMLTILLFVLPMFALNAQLVKDGSFEECPVGVISETSLNGWLLLSESSVSPAPVFEIVSDTVKDGNRALRIIVNGVGSNQWDIQVVADSIPVKRGKQYKYSVWAKTQSGTSTANFTVGNYSYSEYARLGSAAITTQWQEYTLTFTVNDDVTYARAPIHFGFSANSGDTIYIDNMNIIDIEREALTRTPFIVEAESGQLGSNFAIQSSGDVTYVTVLNNYTGLQYPGDTSNIITYEILFPYAETYSLYARIRVNSGGYNDDSFFYGSDFGVRDTLGEDWAFINGLASAGFSDPANVVYDPGGAGTGVWKWVNLSRNKYQGDTTVTFKVEADSVVKIFQIGGREDGLDIDKFAFGRSDLYFTVDNLDKCEPGSPSYPGTVWEGPPLASKQQKFVGCAYSSSQSPNFEAYWNQVIPENGGKWGSVEATRDVMNWGEADAAYQLAKSNGFPFTFHVLVWGAQQPSWISSLPQEEQLEEIREWFQAVCDHFPDIEYLQVVNEPLHAPPDGQSSRANYINALGGAGTTGWDWIINAFRMAREIFPDSVKLMLNDYSIINSTQSTQQYLNIIRLLQADTLIDVIGEQGHAFTTKNTNATVLKANLDSLASTGLPIQISELDIDGPTDGEQLNEYKRVFPLFYEHHSVSGITLWGWRPGLWRNDQKAYLIGQDGAERPALQWLRSYLDTANVILPVEKEGTIAQSYKLLQNYPNPFNPLTKIGYTIPQKVHVTIKVYNTLGQCVTTLFDGEQPQGSYEIPFDGSKLASGVYYYQLRAGNYIETKKLMLLK